MPVKRYKIPIILILVVAISVTIFMWFGRPKPVEVTVKSVGYGLVQDTVANTRAGTIKACRRAGISPSIGGQIVSLPVREGDAVKAGDLLMDAPTNLMSEIINAPSEKFKDKLAESMSDWITSIRAQTGEETSRELVKKLIVEGFKEELGIEMVRAGTAGTHPAFAAMVRELIVERMSDRSERMALGRFGPSHDVCPADCCPSGRSSTTGGRQHGGRQ